MLTFSTSQTPFSWIPNRVFRDFHPFRFPSYTRGCKTASCVTAVWKLGDINLFWAWKSILSLIDTFQACKSAHLYIPPYEPRHEKTCIRGLRPGKTQTGLLSYSDWLESWNFEFRKRRYLTIQAAKKKGADQTARMRIWQKQVFSLRGSYRNLSTPRSKKSAFRNYLSD